ncbi:glycerophosphodiester phosphodiesterase family protein [Dietzia timorensis]|uniref:Glycerophosphoryl diester phosphodiesterase n=1 Tax=Dietzia timorensis TaxID=499555 RepID=A0A173LIG3_9ACTN|nr:glycerophosphodiester phosphodiesterase family protein [Dietzia timorensis]ANI92065.1 Glycerophosphoryl diester phosphodiesterase [Dietzia timorensis]
MNHLPDGFDLQAHRGGIGLHVESSPHSFGEALKLGVTTLELDTQITKDGQVVVTHDRKINKAVCQDTEPLTDGDPQFPYTEHFVKDLTLAQIRTLDCGSLRKPEYPDQQLHPGTLMMTLAEVFDLVRESGNGDVRFNIETKVEAAAPEETAPREQFVRRVHEEITASGFSDRVEIQSFDWGALRLMNEIDPSIPLVALTNGDFLEVGRPGRSPWLGGLDVDDFGGDGVAAAASLAGVKAYSPVDTAPQTCDVSKTGCEPYTTPELVSRAHELGLKVIPWTVDHIATMEYLLDAGVDGIITNYPDVLRQLLADRGIAVAGTE